ncbi:MAG: sensor histidine kinase [Paracoccaceae bacterium]
MFSALIGFALLYSLILFGAAFVAEGAAARGRLQWVRSPWVYTLSVSIYCTAWTFYGAVGLAARSGLEFLAIYIGPTLVMFGWYWGLRRIVQVGRAQRSTSVADFLSLIYGKSNRLAGAVTILALVGITPYIALQLQSVALSFKAFAAFDTSVPEDLDVTTLAFWVSVGLAIFSVMFGTRSIDAQERRYGVVVAVALEAVVKLVALVSVGIFVVWGVGGGMSQTLATIENSPVAVWPNDASRWITMVALSAMAFVTLPRVFHVMVVENDNDRQLSVASWAFPLYLFFMSLFVLPIAVLGQEIMPWGSNPDLYVLTLPLWLGQENLAVLAFLGGFSSATSMVVVASIAIATMVSNHIILPIMLSLGAPNAVRAGDLRQVVLTTRRLTITVVIFLGYLYYRLSGGGEALSSIGLIAFTGVAQIMPPLVLGLMWGGVTRAGALFGLTTGFAIWLYSLFLPSFGGEVIVTQSILDHGPWGLSLLRPTHLFGTSFGDPVVHCVVFSIGLNTLTILLVSLLSNESTEHHNPAADPEAAFEARTEMQNPSQDLLLMVQRVLGPREAHALFQTNGVPLNLREPLPAPTPQLIRRIEQAMAGAVGAATAHAMVRQFAQNTPVSVDDLMAVADEAAQIIEYSRKLETQSEELEQAALELRQANTKLTRLSEQKDAFLSQISHELRTPMTSIRSFSELLRDHSEDPDFDARRFSQIIHDEALRLTGLLDDLLDLSVLEHGQVRMVYAPTMVKDLLEQAQASALISQEDALRVNVHIDGDPQIITDRNRLMQVFINLIVNARKYCDAPSKTLDISYAERGDIVEFKFQDNGSGIPPEDSNIIFEKFSRLSSNDLQGGVGLGLAICAETVNRLGGTIGYRNVPLGGYFFVKLPKSMPSQ